MTTLRVSRRPAGTFARTVARASSALIATAAAVVVITTNAAASSTDVVPATRDNGPGLSVVDTLLLYVVVPGAIFALIALVVVGPSLGRGARHRAGVAIATGPTWIDPAGAQRASSDPRHADQSVGAEPAGPSEQGGVSGRW